MKLKYLGANISVRVGGESFLLGTFIRCVSHIKVPGVIGELLEMHRGVLYVEPSLCEFRHQTLCIVERMCRMRAM